MDQELPLKKMLLAKKKDFAELFRKVVNLHIGTNVIGKPLSDKDRFARVQQAIRESVREEQ
jgi:hypothetical protein